MLIWRWLQSKNKRRTMQLLSNSSAASDCDCSSSTTANESTRTELFSRCRWCMSLKYLRGHSYRSVSHIYTRNHVLSNSVYVRHVFIACFKRIQLKQKITKRWNTKKREYTQPIFFAICLLLRCAVGFKVVIVVVRFGCVATCTAWNETCFYFFFCTRQICRICMFTCWDIHTQRWLISMSHFSISLFFLLHLILYSILSFGLQLDTMCSTRVLFSSLYFVCICNFYFSSTSSCWYLLLSICDRWC